MTSRRDKMASVDVDACNQQGKQLLDLNHDILLHLSTFLDASSLHSLARTCTHMENKLSDTVMWRNAVLRNDGLSETTAKSLIDSDFKIVNISDSKSLVLSVLIQSVETIILDFEDLIIAKEEVEDVSGRINNITYLIAKEYGNSYDLEQALDTLIPLMPILKGLFIFQSATNQSKDGILNTLQIVAELPLLEEIQQISYNKNGVCYNALNNVVPGDRVFDTVKSLCGIQMESLTELAKSFPNMQNLTIRKLPKSEQLRLFCWMPKVRSLCVYHEEYNRELHAHARLRKLIDILPNLQALDLSSMITMQHPRSLTISENTLSKLINTCRSLVVLNISSARQLTFACTKLVIQRLTQLKYLILPARSDGLDNKSGGECIIEMISQYRPQLLSLIGVANDPKTLNLLPNLRYTCVTDSKTVAKLKSNEPDASKGTTMESGLDSVWEAIDMYSQDWYDAHGSEFFHPTNSDSHLRTFDPQVVIPEIVETLEVKTERLESLLASESNYSGFHSRFLRWYDDYSDEYYVVSDEDEPFSYY